MKEPPIVCIACPEGAPDIAAEDYNEHMSQIHGGGQITSLAAQRNVPKKVSNLPPGINPGDLPSPEFMKTLAEIEKASQAPPQTPTSKPRDFLAKDPPSLPVAPKKPLLLTYQYEGQDKEGHDVATLETDLGDRHFVIAYCLTEKRQIEAREVAKLHKEPTVDPKKEAKKK